MPSNFRNMKDKNVNLTISNQLAFAVLSELASSDERLTDNTFA